MHRTIEAGGVERLTPWFKGSFLAIGGFLTLQPVIAVSVAVCMMAICMYRIVAARRFLRGGLAPLASSWIQAGFWGLILSDGVGLLIGGGLIAAIELAPPGVQENVRIIGAITWMATASFGLLAISAAGARHLFTVENPIAGTIAIVATIGLGLVGPGLIIFVAIGPSSVGLANWSSVLALAIWTALLLGLAAAILGVRFTVDQVGDQLIGDFVTIGTGERTLPSPMQRRRGSSAEPPPIPLDSG